MMSKILSIEVTNWLLFLLAILACSFCMRIVFSLLRAIAANYDTDKMSKYGDFYDAKLWVKTHIIFWGGYKSDPTPDLWYNTMIGTIEFLVFPFLICGDQTTIIGAWLGYKVVAQWSAWNKNRLTFNRFLIANALIIIGSFFLAKYFMKSKDTISSPSVTTTTTATTTTLIDTNSNKNILVSNHAPVNQGNTISAVSSPSNVVNVYPPPSVVVYRTRNSGSDKSCGVSINNYNNSFNNKDSAK